MRYVMLIVLWGYTVACGRSPAQYAIGMEGDTLPSFNILLMDSSTRLNSGMIPSGKPVVFLYISPHCPYSKHQTEMLISHIAEVENIRFYLLAPEPYADLKNFYDRYQLGKYANITVGMDEAWFFYYRFNAKGVPYLAIYDKTKKLHRIIPNGLEISELIRAVGDS